MTFSDILKKSFLNSLNYTEIDIEAVALTLAISLLMSLFIFIIYRVTTRKTFYSKSFNISLVAMTIMTTAIIVAVQSSVVISLGMVGALSIVRFRTAIKNPMDLFFLYWSIGVGIICGAGIHEVAIIVSVMITAALLFLEILPMGAAPMILVVNCNVCNLETTVTTEIKKYCRHFKVKSRNITADTLDLVIELRVRTKKQPELVLGISKIEGVSMASLLSHDGEVTV